MQAAADKIIRELEMFGPNLEGFSASSDGDHTATLNSVDKAAAANTDARVDKAKKGKVAAKATGLQYQFQIMDSIGVPRSEIQKFTDPHHWLTYFIPIAMVPPLLLLLSSLGLDRSEFSRRM